MVMARLTFVSRFHFTERSGAHACLIDAAVRHGSSPRFFFTHFGSRTTTDTDNQSRRKTSQSKTRDQEAYVEWINDHDLILTSPEREAWKKLDTDDEREKFIEEFWRVRDTDRDTEENEFKQQYYERVAYANEHFSSGQSRSIHRPRQDLHKVW